MLRSAFETLSHSLSLSDNISSYSGSDPAPLKVAVKTDPSNFDHISHNAHKDDYPHIQFWTHNDYKKWHQASDALGEDSGEGRGSLPFLEHVNGDPITGSEQRSLMKTFRTVWFGLQKEGIAPIKWGRATPDARNWLYKEVSRAHPEMALCERFWKIEQVARDRYPSWAATHLLKASAGFEDTKAQPSNGKSQKRKVKAIPNSDECSSDGVDKREVKRMKTHEGCESESRFPEIIDLSSPESPSPSSESSSSTTNDIPSSSRPQAKTDNPVSSISYTHAV